MEESPFSQMETFSFRKLIGLAIRQGLVTDYLNMPDKVQLTMDGNVYEFEPEEARRYLIRLLGGSDAAP